MNKQRLWITILLAGLLFDVFVVWAAAKPASTKPPVIINNEQGKQVQLYARSYALLIGVSNYINGWKNLDGVKADIAAVKAALEQHGFDVTTLENPTGSELRAAFERFIENYARNFEQRIIVYFAGHGWTLTFPDGRTMGYIVPSDAPLPQNDQIGFEHTAVDMKTIELYATKIQSKHALFMFDSCFSGSVFYVDHTRDQTSVPPVISYKAARPVRQLITSGSEAESVPDQSIFREQFVAALTGDGGDLNNDGYLTGNELGMFLENQVINYSNEMQHPQYGKIRDPKLDKGDMVFQLPACVGCHITPTPRPTATPEPTPTPTPQFELVVTDAHGRKLTRRSDGRYPITIGEWIVLVVEMPKANGRDVAFRWQSDAAGQLAAKTGATNSYMAFERGTERFVIVEIWENGVKIAERNAIFDAQ